VRLLRFLIAIIIVSMVITTASLNLWAGGKELKLSHTDPPGGPREMASILFAEKVKEYTQGRYTVKTYPSGVLGNDNKAVELLTIGGLDLTVAGSSIYGKSVKEMNLLMSPFLVESFEQGWHLYDDSKWIAARYKELEARGIKVLATWEAGFRCLTTRKPVKIPADIKGMKLRVPPAQIHLIIWKTLGANPVSMGLNEVYMAIQQGVVDGQENPIPTIWTNKFYEVAKYVTITNHVYGPIPLSISMKTWKSMTSKDQKAFLKAAKEASAYSRKMVSEQEGQMLKDMKKAGAIIYYPNLKEWYKAVAPAYKEFKKSYNPKLFDELLKEAAKIKAKYPVKAE
jgi:tripartite ATP-independent transporter DctP family solute receptor